LGICYYNIVYHLENAEMTPELCDDLINFSLNDFWDINKSKIAHSGWNYIVSTHDFSAAFLECLKRLVCHHIYSCVLYIINV